MGTTRAPCYSTPQFFSMSAELVSEPLRASVYQAYRTAQAHRAFVMDIVAKFRNVSYVLNGNILFDSEEKTSKEDVFFLPPSSEHPTAPPLEVLPETDALGLVEPEEVKPPTAAAPKPPTTAAAPKPLTTAAAPVEEAPKGLLKTVASYVPGSGYFFGGARKRKASRRQKK